MLCLSLVSYYFSSPRSNKEGGEDLSGLISCLEGVDSAKCIFTYSDDKITGVAVVYSGTDDKNTALDIYELVSTLYGIEYNKIYISCG